MGKIKRTIARRDDLSDLTGATEVLAQFDAPSGETDIAPGTECTLIEDDEPMTIAERPDGTVTRMKRGDRHFEPTAQERPVRPNTTRAKMLEAMLAGETSLPKLMKAFGQDRNLTIAHVHEMWKRHGYGYSVVGDVVTIAPPLGSDDIGDLL